MRYSVRCMYWQKYLNLVQSYCAAREGLRWVQPLCGVNPYRYRCFHSQQYHNILTLFCQHTREQGRSGLSVAPVAQLALCLVSPAGQRPCGRRSRQQFRRHLRLPSALGSPSQPLSASGREPRQASGWQHRRRKEQPVPRRRAAASAVAAGRCCLGLGRS